MKSMTCDSNRRTERADAGRLAAIRIAIASAVILCLVCVGCGEAPEDDGQAGLWVEIRAQRVEVELTKTRQAQALGLSNRDELAWDRGMLFVYREPGFYGFWMKDMRFDIDIVWIRENRIVDITHRVPHPAPDEELSVYRPSQLTSIVLEVPSDYASSHGWIVGDIITFSPELLSSIR